MNKEHYIYNPFDIIPVILFIVHATDFLRHNFEDVEQKSRILPNVGTLNKPSNLKTLVSVIKIPLFNLQIKFYELGHFVMYDKSIGLIQRLNRGNFY